MAVTGLALEQWAGPPGALAERRGVSRGLRGGGARRPLPPGDAARRSLAADRERGGGEGVTGHPTGPYIWDGAFVGGFAPSMDAHPLHCGGTIGGSRRPSKHGRRPSRHPKQAPNGIGPEGDPFEGHRSLPLEGLGPGRGLVRNTRDAG